MLLEVNVIPALAAPLALVRIDRALGSGMGSGVGDAVTPALTHLAEHEPIPEADPVAEGQGLH